MLLKFLALCFIHLQGILFSSDDYNMHRQNLSKKSISRKKALCMAYLHNNAKVQKEKDVKTVKSNMQRKLDLVEDQLRGAKFEQIAGGGVGVRESTVLKKDTFTKQDIDYSIDSNEDIYNDHYNEASIPYLRKGISSYDPEQFKLEEKLFEKKRQALELNERDAKLFREFTEEELKELEKLDILTKIFLFLRKHITNPIFS